MTLKILMFGATGQVAREVLRLADPNVKVIALDRKQADLLKPDQCAARISEIDADVVLNAASYTAVDRAESEQDLALKINAESPAAMARAAAKKDFPFLHISSDYVYDGTGDSPHIESKEARPLGVYGTTKLAGDRAVVEVAGAYAILRTSWVFSAHGANFVKTMRRIGANRDVISVVDDQRGGPTAAQDIAVALISIARQFMNGRGQSGVFHFAGTPAISWRGFAEAVFYNRPGPIIRPITSDEYPTAAERPKNSTLDCSKIQEVYGIQQPDWRRSLRDVIEELEKSDE